MSKAIKQMEMDALKATVAQVRDFVFLSITKVDATTDNQLRHQLRKKNIRLHHVKNSLARRVFDELGMKIPKESPYWEGNTIMAWGGGGIAELSRELDDRLKDLVKKNAKLKDSFKIKGAILEGQLIPFETAKKMPSRVEAIGSIVAAIIGPAAQLASQLTGPASQIASQLQTLAERKPEEAAAAPPAA
jgi:ribosomal protein L10